MGTILINANNTGLTAARAITRKELLTSIMLGPHSGDPGEELVKSHSQKF